MESINDRLLKVINENTDVEQAEKMSAYMKNKFTFAGIPSKKLQELIKPIVKETAKEQIDWNLIFSLWRSDIREAQYVAMTYLQYHRKQLVPKDISSLKTLIINKSWWETVDTIDEYVGELVKQDTSLKEEMLNWAVDDNMWLRRVAIDFQQRYKDNTDVALLEKILVSNFGSKEFFINKAIGWSLREYSKVNPEWVSNFIDTYQGRMSSLSVREASKYLAYNEAD